MDEFKKNIDYTKSISWQSFPNDKKLELINEFKKVIEDKSLDLNYYLREEYALGEFLSKEIQIEDALRPACRIITEHYGIDKDIGCSIGILEDILYHNPDNKKITKAVETYYAAKGIANMRNLEMQK